MGYELKLLQMLVNGKGITPGIQRAIDENNVTDLMWEIEAALYNTSKISTLCEATSGDLE